MTKSVGYHEQLKIDYIERLRGLLKILPPFLGEYFRGTSNTSSGSTKVAYAYDLKIFFTYICENHKTLRNKKVTELKLSDLELITPEDIEIFMDYISLYDNPNIGDKGKRYKNNEKGKARKLCAIKSVYKFFYKRRRLQTNPADLVISPKLHEKNITVLEPQEVAILIDNVESGEKLTDTQKRFHEHTQKRDVALVTLLLGTGIRISECIGIDISDLDFDLNGVKIVRKGGNETTVYFGDEVRSSLLEYLEIRSAMPDNGSQALFLSMQNKRINVRTVQNLVKKYAETVTTLKRITPHKLRSTYGTTLYNESGDIYLVADALGHKDVNTTKKHYAKIDDERRKLASKYIRLREN